MVDNAFKVGFDEGLMEDPVGKSMFLYNGKPVVSRADDSDIGEILSAVLNIFRDAADVKFNYIADELAERLNLKMMEVFKENFATRAGKFSPFYLENIAVFPKKPDAGNFNNFVDETRFLFLFNIRGF